MSFGTISAWIGILAAILAVPLNIIANILTPHVQLWWAKTNESRRQNRLKSINDKLEYYKDLLEVPQLRQAAMVRAFRLCLAGLVLFAFSLLPLFIGIEDIHRHLAGIEIREYTERSESILIMILSCIATSAQITFLRAYKELSDSSVFYITIKNNKMIARYNSLVDKLNRKPESPIKPQG